MRIAIADLHAQSGKTTLALNLGAALAQRGASVLLVDADPEGALASFEGLAEAGKVLDRRGAQILRSTSVQGLHVVTGTGRWLVQTEGTVDWSILEPQFPKFDWVVFDTGSAHRNVVQQVLQQSDQVLTPLEMTPTSFAGMPEILRLLVAEHRTRPELTFAGFVHTCPQQTAIAGTVVQDAAQETLRVMRQEFPQVCLHTAIPFDPTLQRRATQHGPLLVKEPAVCAAFAALADELAERVGRTFPSPTAGGYDHTETSQRRSWWQRLFGQRHDSRREPALSKGNESRKGGYSLYPPGA